MGRYRLRYLDHEIPVREGSFVIGRLPECDLRLGGTHVSRRHARLLANGDAIAIEDLGSRNGIRVNGRTVRTRVSLATGDVIGIGLDTLTIVDDTCTPPSRQVITVRPPPMVPVGESDIEDANAVTVQVRIEALTKREREVFELMAQGLTHREIAERLFVSIKTIETHRTRIGEKLGCRNLREIMHSAMVSGILRSRAES